MAESQLLKRVIAPKQNFILDAFEEILEFYDINLDLFFIPLTEEVTTTISRENRIIFTRLL